MGWCRVGGARGRQAGRQACAHVRPRPGSRARVLKMQHCHESCGTLANSLPGILSGPRPAPPSATSLCCSKVYAGLVEDGVITPAEEFSPPMVPMDLGAAKKAGKVRSFPHKCFASVQPRETCRHRCPGQPGLPSEERGEGQREAEGSRGMAAGLASCHLCACPPSVRLECPICASAMPSLTMHRLNRTIPPPPPAGARSHSHHLHHQRRPRGGAYVRRRDHE